MAGISDKAIKSQYAENKYRGNGGDELQNKEFSDGSGLEMYDAFFRGYDPQIGRFWQIDPLADIGESRSPYSFAGDNPINYNDPLGLTNPADTGTGKTNLDPVVVTAKKRDCKTCAPSPAAHVSWINPGAPETIWSKPGTEPTAKPTTRTEPSVEPLVGGPGVLGTAGLTFGLTILPLSGGDSHVDWERYDHDELYFMHHPEETSNPYVGHGNNKGNTDPHIVYQFTFKPPTGDPRTPVLKYGISDEYRFGLDRPESQLAGLRAKYGPTVMYSIYTRTISRGMALLIEAQLVGAHKEVWGELPREQLRPNP